MNPHQKFAKASRDATYKRKLQCHAQAAASTVKRTTGEEQKMLRLSKTLSEVVRDYQTSRNEGAKSSGLAILESFPKLTLDNDKKFIAGQRVMKALGHFQLRGSPVGKQVSSHFVRHSYLLDAPAILTFVLNVQTASPSAKQDLTTIAPRITELCDDFLALEALAVLSVLENASLSKLPCWSKLLDQIVLYGGALSMEKLCVAVKLAGNNGYTSACMRLLPLIEGSVSSLSKEALRTLCIGLLKVSVPRRLMNDIARRSMSLKELSPGQLASVAHLFHMQSYRHERLFAFIAQQQTEPTALEKQTGNSLALTISAMSHFYCTDSRLVSLLKRSEEVNLTGAQIASICYAVARVNGNAKTVRVLTRKLKEAKTVSTASLANVLWSVLTLNLVDDCDMVVWLVDSFVVAQKKAPNAGALSTVMKCASLVGPNTPVMVSEAVKAAALA